MYDVIILFGVSGCGKSLIGNQLSKDLQFEFIEGDDFHSNENIKKIGRSSFEKHYEYNFPNYFGIGLRFGILKGGTLRGY